MIRQTKTPVTLMLKARRTQHCRLYSLETIEVNLLRSTLAI